MTLFDRKINPLQIHEINSKILQTLILYGFITAVMNDTISYTVSSNTIVEKESTQRGGGYTLHPHRGLWALQLPIITNGARICWISSISSRGWSLEGYRQSKKLLFCEEKGELQLLEGLCSILFGYETICCVLVWKPEALSVWA